MKIQMAKTVEKEPCGPFQRNVQMKWREMTGNGRRKNSEGLTKNFTKRVRYRFYAVPRLIDMYICF